MMSSLGSDPNYAVNLERASIRSTEIATEWAYSSDGNNQPPIVNEVLPMLPALILA
jgi:hypothetical protein